MKDLNMTEMELRSWRPRQPSAELRRNFTTSDNFPSPGASWLWGCLAPAAACVLALMSLSHGSDDLGQKPALFLGTNHEIYAADSGQMTQNHLAAVTFDWTNHSGFKSSMGFTPTTNFSN
jgi:hypothetical protein